MPTHSSRLLLAALACAALAGCGKDASEAEAQSSRGLKVEAYDAPIGKDPLGGRLETMRPHAEPVVASSAPPAASSAPAASDAAPQAARDARPPQAIQRVASRSRTAPAAPPVIEPHRDLYEGQPARTDAPESDPPGFRLTVPMCRRAERLNDPLAQSAECVQLIAAARTQAEICQRAFEDGDDKAALSEGCRQAAGFR